MPPEGGKGAFIEVFRHEVNETPLYGISFELRPFPALAPKLGKTPKRDSP